MVDVTEVEAEFFGGPADGAVHLVSGTPEVRFPILDGMIFTKTYGKVRPSFGTISYWRVKSDGPRLRYEYRP